MGAEDVLFALFGIKITVAHGFTIVVGIFSVSPVAYLLITDELARSA